MIGVIMIRVMIRVMIGVIMIRVMIGTGIAVRLRLDYEHIRDSHS